MQQIEVIIPALYVSLDTVRNKLVPLLAAGSAPHQILVHAYSSQSERHFFFERKLSVDVQAKYETSVKVWCEQLRQTLAEVSGAIEYTVVRDRDIEPHWHRLHKNDRDSLVVMFLSQRGFMPFYRAMIRRTDTPVLAVFEGRWHSPISLVAAIDPFHQQDEQTTRDIHLIQRTRELGRALAGRTTLFHSCHVPPYLADHRRDIERHFRQNLREFVQDHGFANLPCVVDIGSPSEKLREYVSDNGVDILAIGSVARGFLDRYVLGSTADQILSVPPCDLLLLRS